MSVLSLSSARRFRITQCEFCHKFYSWTQVELCHLKRIVAQPQLRSTVSRKVVRK
uniref:Uncharacterized protein n=1 Tax=Hyaloperonospora arabidopsidis (strain Emoy2) TaxID=559515 RepID=M4BFJ5_HYAAE